MKRIELAPRVNWQQRLEDEGCFYHTIDGEPYWNDGAAYEFTLEEVELIEDTTNELQALCLDHVATTIERGDYAGYGFPTEVKELIQQSWERDSAEGSHVIGRMDFGFDPETKALKLYEYNADTPTSLPEAAVWQWQAKEDREWPDQFNSIHEELASRWHKVLNYANRYHHVHFTCSSEGRHEDWGNVHYMMQVVTEKNPTVTCTALDIKKVGWSKERNTFTDENERDISLLYKLYPWEWLMAETFGWGVKGGKTNWIEPAWKMLLSTKALLPRAWKAHRGHPNLLPAFFEKDVLGTSLAGAHTWVRKPLLGREGINTTIVKSGCDLPAVVDPAYDDKGYVVQEYLHTKPFGLYTPVIGSWVVGNKACGMGVREDKAWVTSNNSQFVPHYFVEG
jgi:glutathionylspermidine synthase